MKKDLIFAPVLLAIGIVLGMLKMTGLTVHIAVSVVGVVVLAAYTVATKKEWTIPGLEVLMRLCYGIALISGVVVMNMENAGILAIAHKAFAGAFLVLLVVLTAKKVFAKKA